MCGNGVRMVARKLQMEGLLTGATVVLETAAGEIVPRLGDGYMVTVDMGIARFGGEKLSGFDGDCIEESLHFPRKANVEFVVVTDKHNAKVRVWERGVGETRACGTGATATAVALVRTGQCVSPVTVELPGGKLVVEVKPDWRVFMTGPAEEIYHGDLSLEFLEHLE